MTRHLIQEAVVYETYAEHEREQMQDLINERIKDGWNVSHLCSAGDYGCTVVFNRWNQVEPENPGMIETHLKFMEMPILLHVPVGMEREVAEQRVRKLKRWFEHNSDLNTPILHMIPKIED